MWSQNLDLGISKQVFCDLLSSRDGRVVLENNTRRTEVGQDGNIKVIDPQYVQMYFTNSDLVYPSTGWKGNCTQNLLMGAGAFERSLKVLFKETHGYEPEFQNYGKPNLQHFKFVENKILSEQSTAIKTIYMIGDNLRSDILGANTINGNSNINWVSIAVKTGLFKTEEDVEAHAQQTGIPYELLKPQIIV